MAAVRCRRCARRLAGTAERSALPFPVAFVRKSLFGSRAPAVKKQSMCRRTVGHIHSSASAVISTAGLLTHGAREAPMQGGDTFVLSHTAGGGNKRNTCEKHAGERKDFI